MTQKRILSFKYAFDGLFIGLKDEVNLRIQLVLGILGLIMGVYYRLTTTEWLFGVISFGLVVGAELLNTAIEEIIDHMFKDYHDTAKKVKDLAAAAVLVLFLTEVVIGLIIFIPYLFHIPTHYLR